MQLKRDKKVRARTVLTKKREAWSNMRTKGINVSNERMQQLQQLADKAAQTHHVLDHVFAINVASQALDSLRYITFHEIPRGTAESDETADYEKLKKVLKHEATTFTAQALVVQIVDFVNDFDRTLLAAATMMRMPVVILCEDAALHEEVNKATGSVWHICGSEADLLTYLEKDLGHLIGTVKAIADDVSGKVEKYKHVNKLQHGLKRGAVAFIPMAVYAVNFLGISRLVRRMLKKTGMLNDSEAKKAASVEAAVTGVKVTLIDAMGDVYQFTITATLLAGFATEVSAAGLEAGLASLSALDFALLGSITLVTGTISAIGAYIARPKMVEAVANLISILQVACLLNPKLRRKEGDQEQQEHKPKTQLSRMSQSVPLRAASGELAPGQAAEKQDLSDLADSDGDEMDESEVQPLLQEGSDSAAGPSAVAPDAAPAAVDASSAVTNAG